METEKEHDRGALCEECDQWEYNEDGSCRTFMVCGACWNKRSDLSRLERELIQKAKTWNATNHRDKLAVERALTDLGDAVDALLDFEQKQETK